MKRISILLLVFCTCRLRFCSLPLLVLVACLGYGQGTSPLSAVHPDQELRVRQLPLLQARSDDPSDVLRTSLDILFRNREVCCGKDSALEDQVLRADPSSLKDIAGKLQGRHQLSDGRPIMVTAEIVPTSGPRDISFQIISLLADERPMLMILDSHLYVLYGVIFDQTIYADGSSMNMIHKLLLLDARYAGTRREAVFDRDKDDWNKVQGLLLVDAKPQ